MILLMLSLFLGACTVTDPPEGSADDTEIGRAHV